jgi:hypothetical protein
MSTNSLLEIGIGSLCALHRRHRDGEGIRDVGPAEVSAYRFRAILPTQ